MHLNIYSNDLKTLFNNKLEVIKLLVLIKYINSY